MAKAEITYITLLQNKEFKAIQGRHKLNQWVLMLIIILSIGCIGVALNIFSSLKQRMNNPFTNWVNLPVLAEYRDSIKTTEEHILSSENMNRFQLSTIVEYNQNMRPIFDKTLTNTYYLFIRSMDYEEELFKKFLEPNNIVYLKKNLNFLDSKCNIFISQKLFNDLEMEWSPEGDHLLAFDYRQSKLLLNVIGVVKNIPNFADLVCSPEMMNLMSEPVDKTRFYSTSEGSEISFLSFSEIEDIDKHILNENQLESMDVQAMKIYGNTNIFKYKLWFKNFIKYQQLDSLKNIIQAKYSASMLDVLEWDCVESSKYFEKPQYVAFNFVKLDKVRAFRDYLKDKFQISLDISEVEDKENFALVSQLATAAIISIIVLGVFCYIVFLFFLIRSHIESIKQNIGTFMAFGLSNKAIEKVYIFILSKLLFYSIGLGIFVLIIVNLIYRLLHGLDFMLLFHWLILIVIVAYFIIGYLIVRYLVKKTCVHTPGDLIYSRI